MNFGLNNACWHHYPQDALQELMATHPLLFPDFEWTDEPIVPEYSVVQRVDQPFRDDWGCVWQTTDDGITGTVVVHPLADWSALETYEPPDPAKVYGLGPIDWAEVAEHIATAESEDRVARGGLRHGHTFMQLADIRGYQGLTYDMVDGEPRLWRLIEMVEAFNTGLIERYLALDVQVMAYPEDLGMQVGPMVSPPHFRKYIQPTYERMMRLARGRGCMIHMHSDGDIRTLLDDIIGAGVEIMNLQDLVNGVDWIAEHLLNRGICIQLDLDRQRITRFGTPAEIDALIRYEVERLGSPLGGFMLTFGLYPGTPLENVRAIMDAMERYAFHFTT
jgi:uroporphyrinogen decarboxylase